MGGSMPTHAHPLTPSKEQLVIAFCVTMHSDVRAPIGTMLAGSKLYYFMTRK